MNKLRIKFVGVDYWNRPVFKGMSKNSYYGDTDHLFREGATESEVIEYYKEFGDENIGDTLKKYLTYFGSKFGCEPMGTPINNDTVVEFVKGRSKKVIA